MAPAQPDSAYALVEFCLVLPIFLLLVLGSIDVGNMMHSYNAAKEGVKTAIRCAAATDGLCAGAPARPGDIFFDISLVEAEPEYLLQTANYDGSASWLASKADVYTATAEILERAVFKASGKAPGIGAQLVKYPATGSIGYLVRTDLSPRIGGEALHPTFSRRDGEAYEPSIIRSLAGINGQTRAPKRVSIGTAEFSLPRPEGALLVSGRARPCFLPQAASSAPAALRPEFSKPCSLDESWPWSSGQTFGGQTFIKPGLEDETLRFTYIVLHVTGRVDPVSTEVGAVGKVSLVIEQDGQARSLGGRTFDLDSSGNFVVRGAPLSAFSPEAGRYEEYELHQAIRIKYSTPFSLKFTLESLNGKRVGWRGGTAKIFAPRYQSGEFGADCLDGIFKSEISKPDICDLDLARQGSRPGARIYASEPPKLDFENPAAAGPLLDLGCGSNNSSFEDRLRMALAAVEGARPAEDYRTSDMSGTTCLIEPHEESLDCPGPGLAFPGGAPNLGVARDKDPDGFIRDSAEAQNICSPLLGPYLSRHRNLEIGDLRWTTRSEDVQSPPEFIFRPRNCQELEPSSESLPSEWREFAKLETKKDTARDIRLPMPPPPGQTIDSALSLPEYACPAFSKQTLGLKDIVFRDGFSLTEPIADLGCAWRDKIRAALLTSNIPQDAELSITKRETADYVSSPAPPGDKCAAYRVVPDGRLVLHRLGRFREGDFPPICAEAPGRCRASYAAAMNQSSSSLDLVRASRSGYEAIQAAIPGARADCTGSFCAKVDVVSDEGAIRATGSVMTPLLVLGRRPLPISYSENRLLETEIVG